MARKSAGSGAFAVVGFLVLAISMCRGGGERSQQVARDTVQGAGVDTSAYTSQAVIAQNETHFVSTRALNQRSAPNGAVVGKLTGGDSVVVYERRGTWSRISPEGSSARWVSSNLICSGYGCYRPPAVHPKPSPPTRPVRSNFSDGSCPCSGSHVCIGPRGGRYCITSGGNKRYGV